MLKALPIHLINIILLRKLSFDVTNKHKQRYVVNLNLENPYFSEKIKDIILINYLIVLKKLTNDIKIPLHSQCFLFYLDDHNENVMPDILT